MDHGHKARFFMWNTIINAIILILWTVTMTTSADFIYEMHGKLFTISRENFNVTIYGLLGLFKILFIIFNLAPLIACLIVKKKSASIAS